jgi:hypothetical protein
VRHYRSNTIDFETKYFLNLDKSQYSTNIFDAKNNSIVVNKDGGGNVNVNGTRTTITIPQTGLYKIDFLGTITMLNEETGDINRLNVRSGSLNDVPVEIHLVKNLDKSLFDINFNNKFSNDNINQNVNDSNAIFPQPNRVNFIDPKQDKNFVCGFAFGRHPDENYRNPLNSNNCNPMAITGGQSWDFDNGNGVTDRTYSAVYSPVYKSRNGDSDSFKVDLLNADTQTSSNNDALAQGTVRQVVWLEKGDRLDLITTTKLTIGVPLSYIYGYSINYNIEIAPFNHNKNWLKIDSYGSSTEPMNWNDQGTFIENQIDLIKALPSEVKVNDWIDNFCRAFNLILYSTGGKNFNLDIKDKGIIQNTSIIIDLDKKANVSQSINKPLNLPYMYELGFTVDQDEEGYIESITEFDDQGEPVLSSGDDGGGTFYTGSQDANIINQTSNFSYSWYKRIRYTIDGTILELPIITDHEIWEFDYDYEDMISNLYLDKAQRFWYKSGVKEIEIGQDRTTTIALVSNEYNGDHKQVLNYGNEANSIMRNYFLLLTNSKHYTVVECFLTPVEYSKIDISLVKFNGDIYNIADIDKYDPTGKNKATLKLIRKLLKTVIA